MGMPDQPLVDYTKKQTIWDILNLSWSPEALASDENIHSNIRKLHDVKLPISSMAAQTNHLTDVGEINRMPDWNTFGFASVNNSSPSFYDDDSEEMSQSLARNLKHPASSNLKDSKDLDVDSFFQNIIDPTANSNTGGKRALTPEEEEDAYDFQDEYEEDEQVTPQVMAARLANLTIPVICKNFVTPPTWLEKQEMKDHVGFDVWSRYEKDQFDDTNWSWDDLAMFRTTQHIINITDMYLTDHLELKRDSTDRRTWDRILYAKFTNENLTQEPVPIFLTPDINRGVNYSDNIIEMKSKMVLETKLPPPEVLFADDKFTNNEELETLNKIGTIRAQYTWAPTVELGKGEIDPNVVAKIEPVLTFINHAATLKSTKVCIVKFFFINQYEVNFLHD
jgi:hypothetical protein